MYELSPSERADAFQRSVQRVRAKLGFAGHAVLFVVVGVLALIVNLVVTPGVLWFFWPMLFWVFALAAHAAVVFGPGRFAIDRWRQREFGRELDRVRAERVGSRSDVEGSSRPR